jgi:hypothetical protein
MPSGPGYKIDCATTFNDKLTVTGNDETWDIKKITLSDGCVVPDYV